MGPRSNRDMFVAHENRSNDNYDDPYYLIKKQSDLENEDQIENHYTIPIDSSSLDLNKDENGWNKTTNNNFVNDEDESTQQPLFSKWRNSPRRSRRSPTLTTNNPENNVVSLPLSSSSRKSKKNKNKKHGQSFLHRLYHRIMMESSKMTSFTSLLVAVILWYLLGVVSIGTSKLLLMTHPQDDPQQQQPPRFSPQHNNDHYHASKRHFSHHHHHHHLIGGVPPLYLTLQQFFIGTWVLRFLIHIRFLGSPGLTPWPRSSTGTTLSLLNDFFPVIHLQLLASSFFFALGFLMTNYGFSASSASFVETVKAAEPITGAAVAVGWGIEVLSPREIQSLMAIVFGVLLSTLSNTGTAQHQDHRHHRMVFLESLHSCIIVMVANVAFSFRGLCQKLFRRNPEGTTSIMDDLNLQFRMQQIGIVLLIGPVIFWDMIRILLYLRFLIHHDLRTTIVTRYLALALLNGFCFATYNLASTYILSRISVVQHAALNSVRRVFAIVVTSMYFVVPITFFGSLGIFITLGGFMSFTHFKIKRQRQPIASSLPISVNDQ